MPIEVKELIVRAFISSQAGENKSELKRIAKTAEETNPIQAEMLEQLKKMFTDKKDR